LKNSWKIVSAASSRIPSGRGCIRRACHVAGGASGVASGPRVLR
jgi:hypothetical protein